MTGGPGIQSPLGAKPPPGTDRAVAELNSRSALKVFAGLLAIVVVLTAILLAVLYL